MRLALLGLLASATVAAGAAHAQVQLVTGVIHTAFGIPVDAQGTGRVAAGDDLTVTTQRRGDQLIITVAPRT